MVLEPLVFGQMTKDSVVSPNPKLESAMVESSMPVIY